MLMSLVTTIQLRCSNEHTTLSYPVRWHHALSVDFDVGARLLRVGDKTRGIQEVEKEDHTTQDRAVDDSSRT